MTCAALYTGLGGSRAMTTAETMVELSGAPLEKKLMMFMPTD